MKKLSIALALALACVGTIHAQEVLPTPEPTPWYENEPAYTDNTGPISSGENSANITGSEGEGDIQGKQAGEITLFRSDVGVDVYSGMNKVETIQYGSDGWTGSILEDTTSLIKFHPSGRPILNCPAEELAHWFGPCKLEEGQEG